MNLKNMMLSKRGQTQKATSYRMILFIQNVQKRQIHRDRKQISGPGGLGMRVENDEGFFLG